MKKLTGFNFDDTDKLKESFLIGKPVPSVVIKNFLKEDIALGLYEECQYSNLNDWKTFTRNGSHMKEYNNIETLPKAYDFYSYISSGPFLKQLEAITGIQGLIPDPHLIGAGYSRSFNGDILKVHTDFNWNDTLKLYRVLSLIVYLTPDWQEEWGGGLSFFDSNREKVISTLPCLFNNCVVWKYDERAFHGYTRPITCPEDKSRNSIRAFYYTSNIEHASDFKPHRSLYWFDENTKEAFDKKEEI
jgi:Rps23 Pro-64 3,4-dihydroxylase Tpa1-like proline 4-hydroxylase